MSRLLYRISALIAAVTISTAAYSEDYPIAEAKKNQERELPSPDNGSHGQSGNPKESCFCDWCVPPNKDYPTTDSLGKLYIPNDKTDLQQFVQHQKALKTDDERRNLYFRTRYLTLADKTTASISLLKNSYDALQLTKFSNGRKTSETTHSTNIHSFARNNGYNTFTIYKNRYLLEVRRGHRASQMQILDLVLAKEIFSEVGWGIDLINDQVVNTEGGRYPGTPCEILMVNAKTVFPHFIPDNHTFRNDVETTPVHHFVFESEVTAIDKDTLTFTGKFYPRPFNLYSGIDEEEKAFEAETEKTPLVRVKVHGVSKLGTIFDPKTNVTSADISFTTEPIKETNHKDK